MAERNTKGGADTKRDLTTRNDLAVRSEPDTQGAIDQLGQVLEELRSSVVSLTDRVGEGLVTASDRGLQQARQMVGVVAEDVVDRATAIRSRVQDQSPAVIVVAFFAGAILQGCSVLSISGP
jgi:hypothetical protein